MVEAVCVRQYVSRMRRPWRSLVDAIRASILPNLPASSCLAASSSSFWKNRFRGALGNDEELLRRMVAEQFVFWNVESLGKLNLIVEWYLVSLALSAKVVLPEWVGPRAKHGRSCLRLPICLANAPSVALARRRHPGVYIAELACFSLLGSLVLKFPAKPLPRGLGEREIKTKRRMTTRFYLWKGIGL